MNSASKHINELWTCTINMRFFSETHKKFKNTRVVINNAYYTLKIAFDKNDPNNRRNTTIIQYTT